MTMRSITICLLFISTLTVVSAQDSGIKISATDALERLQQREINGQVLIYMDSLIIDNYMKHLVYNSKNRGVKGFRIRIFSDNGQGAKDDQKRVTAKFLSLYPEIPTYPTYEGSYYKIYVGDYRTRREALRSLQVIDRKFPDAFIVEDNIVIDE